MGQAPSISGNDELTARQRRRLIWMWIVSAAGLADSVWLSYLHYNSGAACRVSSWFNCDLLHIAKYSEWFGLPVAAYSTVFYVCFLETIHLSRRRIGSGDDLRPVLYPWLFSWVALGMTLVMAGISLVLIRALCPFCSVLYVLSLVNWVLARGMMRDAGRPWLEIFGFDLSRALRSREARTVAVSGLIVMAGAITIDRDLSGMSKRRFTLDLEKAGAEARALGVAGAPIDVVEFSDFQCPYCRIGGEVLKELETELRGTIRVHYKFYPLDRSCNPNGGMHPVACKAAQAAFCAAVEGKFWGFHDLAFARQKDLSEAEIYRIAGEAGLNMGSFGACMADPRSLEVVRADVTEGDRLGVQGTPTLFISGRKYSGELTVEALRQAVAQEMAAAR